MAASMRKRREGLFEGFLLFIKLDNQKLSVT